MIVCRCGKKIEYFLVIGFDIIDPKNHTNQVLFQESYFLCQACFEKESDFWIKHNKGRNIPYIIEFAKVNITVSTKAKFIERVEPQLFSQFEKKRLWLPKTDIKRAMGTTLKIK